MNISKYIKRETNYKCSLSLSLPVYVSMRACMCACTVCMSLPSAGCCHHLSDFPPQARDQAKPVCCIMGWGGVGGHRYQITVEGPGATCHPPIPNTKYEPKAGASEWVARTYSEERYSRV